LKKKLRQILGVFAVIALAIELFYLMVANTLINTSWLSRTLSRNPQIFSITWSSGWSLLPGRFHIEALDMRGNTAKQSWRIGSNRADFSLALWALPFRSVRFHDFTADNLVAGMSERIAASDFKDNYPVPISYQTDIDPCMGVPAFHDLNSQAQRPRWNFVIRDLRVARELDLTYYDFRLSTAGELDGEDLCLVTRGPVGVRTAKLRLTRGELTAGIETVTQNLNVDGTLRISPLVLAENPRTKAARFVSGSLSVSGNIASYEFINQYLSDTRWLSLHGIGQVSGSIRLHGGVLADGTALTIDSPRLGVELDESRLLGTDTSYRIAGAGSVNAEVLPVDGNTQAQLRVALRDMEMRRFPEDRIFAHGDDFVMTATAQPIDLSILPPPPVFTMEWREAVMPDIGALNAYLPGNFPLKPTKGSAHVTARMTYADGLASGALNLAGQDIAGVVLEEPVHGEMSAALILRQADLRKRTLDLAGSRIEVLAAADAWSEEAPFRTWIEVRESDLRLAPRPPGLENTPPTFSGSAILFGAVANIELLGQALAVDQDLHLEGNGKLTAKLLFDENRLSEDSQVHIESDRLSCRLQGLQAKGMGKLVARIAEKDHQQFANIEMAFEDAEIQRIDDNRTVLQGEILTLAASSPMTPLVDRRSETEIEMDWANAVVPDVSVINAYLIGDPPFQLEAGVLSTQGRLRYSGRNVSGRLSLEGENVTGLLFDEPVTGQLTVDLVVNEAQPDSRLLDLTGTQVRMQASTPEAGTDAESALVTEIELTEARLESASPDSTRTEPQASDSLSGIVRLSGHVANLGFLNHFLDARQGLAFGGDGKLSGDLHLTANRMSPGSRVELASPRLTSRFLDFEATGSGRITAALTGNDKTPGLRLLSVLSDVDVRRQGDTTPYISGAALEVDAQSDFDDLRNPANQEARIKLTGAELPDISVYNRYLPKKAGLTLASGRGELNADLNLSGRIGNGTVELRAPSARIHLRDQILEADLALTTRMEEGDLESMAFDISGTRLRIDNAYLPSGRSKARDRDWWGQLDLERGTLIWREPLTLNAEAVLSLRDSGLFVHLFFGDQTRDHPWLEKRLHAKNIKGRTLLSVNDRTIRLTDAQLQSGKLEVRANLLLGNGHRRGGLFAGYGDLDVGIEVEDDKRDWKIIDTNKWFQEYGKRFREQER